MIMKQSVYSLILLVLVCFVGLLTTIKSTAIVADSNYAATNNAASDKELEKFLLDQFKALASNDINSKANHQAITNDDRDKTTANGGNHNEQLAPVPSHSKPGCRDGVYNYMDNIASKLRDAIQNGSNGRQLLKELQEAINMVDLLKIGAKTATTANKMVSMEATEERKFGQKSKGLLELLDIEKEEKSGQKNEHIVHQNRKLSEEALKELDAFAKSGPVSTERFMEFFSDPRWNNKYYSPDAKSFILSKKIQAVKDFLINGFNSGASLMDQLYLSPHFLEQIPIIGREVTKLKEKGQAMYDIIKTVRSFKTFLERYHAGKKIALKLTTAGKQMLGDTGMIALKFIAFEMLKSYTGVDMNPIQLTEIAGRCAYYMLIQLAPAQTC